MNNTTAIILIFIVCCMVSVFYWHVLQATVLRAIRFKLFARRDRLRRLAIEEEVDYNSFAYRSLEGFICKTVSVVPSISLASLIVFSIRHPNLKSEEMERFRKEASPELRGILQKTAGDALLIMTFNSPILGVVAGTIVLVLWGIGRINKIFVYTQAEQFVDDLPPEREDHEPIPQAA